MDVNVDQKFHQRWEFRRKDDENDSSSDDSKSNSTDDPAKRRLQLVPVLTSSEDDQLWIDQRSQEKNRPHTNLQDTNINARQASGKSNESGKRSRVAKGIESSRKGKAAAQKINRNATKVKKLPKKKQFNIREPLLVEELKIFSESMISEIKTARENMLVQMKQELLKLVAVTRSDTVPCSRMNTERKTQNRHGVAVGQCSKSNKAVEDRVVSNQAIAIVAPDATESRERLMSSLQKPVELTQDSTQMVPTSYFTLPNVFPPLHLHPGSDLYFKNHLLPGIAANYSASNVDTSNSITGVDNHHGLLIEPEQLGYSYPISSRHIGLLGDKRINKESALSTGFPRLLHRPTTNILNVHSPMLLEDMLRVNNRAGPRMNEGSVRFSQ